MTMSAGPLLKADALTKSFGTTPALRGCDIAVEPGEMVAVMGPSGSGKSTLLHCLAGILRPDAGAVYYDGSRVDDLDEAGRSALRRSEFGFVFQFGQLVPELSAAENAALPLMLAGVKRREALRTARRWLSVFEVGELAGRLPGELSGGEAQRVAVARAIVAEPRVIFADEPTGSLDSHAGTSVLDAFTAVARKHDVAVIIVTHEARVAAYADRLVTVRDGRIVVGAPR